MSIPVYTEMRAAVAAEAQGMDHPTKGVIGPDGEVLKVIDPHRYGSIVYFEGGHVGVKIKGRYLIAEGDSHEDSIWALAFRLKATPHDPRVKVAQVSAGHFWLRAAAGK